MTIKEMFGLGPMVDVYQSNKAQPLPYVAAPWLYQGVELEIEGVADPESWKVAGMHHEADGSLRNNGVEFITSPMTLSNLSFVLQAFAAKSKVTSANYSERCSIHVHTNVRDVNLEQVQTILILYQLFERLFFAFVGEDRDKNIFCVPWNQTLLNHRMFERDEKVTFKKWQKYTALNLIPMTTQGTIEWRHMPGHCNFNKVILWCNIIGSLYKWAAEHDVETTFQRVLQLNSNSEYEHIFNECFGPLAQYLWTPNARELLEEGVLDVKLTAMNDKLAFKKQPNKATKSSEMFQANIAGVAHFNMPRWDDDVERVVGHPPQMLNVDVLNQVAEAQIVAAQQRARRAGINPRPANREAARIRPQIFIRDNVVQPLEEGEQF